MEKKENKRLAFPCEVCGAETISTRKVEVIAHMNKIYHISEWRACPLRKGEKGCGHWQLFKYEIPAGELEEHGLPLPTKPEEEQK